MPGVIFAICIAIGVPLVVLFYAIIKKQYLPFLLGMLAFVGSQVLLRIPLLDYLQAHSTTYLMFSVIQPMFFAVVLGLSAGIFEELARFIMMRYLMKQRNWQAGFLFGAGHGGIEAVLFVGISASVILFSPAMSMYNVDFFVGGIERFFAMMLHIGLSIIVLKGVVEKKFIYVVFAIFIHGFVDALVGILPLFMSSSTALIAIEVLLAITALAVFTYSLSIKKRGVL